MLRTVLDRLGPSAPDDDPLDGVVIRTDEYGVSHLHADDRYALAYALGYVQARDRLFEMDVLRHVGYGDSASVLGPGQIASDVQVRRDGYTRAEIREQYERASPTARESLDGFAAGVNRSLLERLRTGTLPAEFVALGHRPELWSPEDSVAVVDYMLGFFGVFGGRELENARRYARLVESLGSREAAYEALGDLTWLRVPEDHYATIPRAEATVDGGEDVLPFADVPDEQLELAAAAADAEPWGIETDVDLPPSIAFGRRQARGVLSGFRWGSNALAVSGEHTETGAPMLFGGPQMGYFKPPVVYEVGLHGAGFDVRGVATVGTPGLVIGRTPEFAWTVTSGRDEMIDTLAVDLHPEDRHRYRWDGEWHEMSTETVTHRSSLPGALFGDDRSLRYVRQEVARVEEGGETMPVVAWNEDERVAWIHRSTVRGDELDGAFRWTELGRQDDVEGLRHQLREFPFSFNFLYADADTIGYLHTGRLPERNPALDARLPAPAADHDWRGERVGVGIGAHVEDPDQGYLLNWNNAPAGDYRSGEAPGNWGRVHRADLLDRAFHRVLAAADGALSLDDVAGVLRYVATHDAVARYSTPRLVEVARERGLDGMARELDRWRRADYPWRATDGRYDDAGHAIWDETRRQLQALAFRPELGDLTPELQFEPPRAVDPEDDESPHAGDHGRTDREVTLVDALHSRAAHDWFGEPVDDAIARALWRARDALADRFETDEPVAWRATEHTSKFRSLGAGVAEEIPMVNRGSWNQVVALGEAAEGRAVLPPGNSGHVPIRALPGLLRGREPAHLTDELDRYVNFEYRPLPVTAAEREAVDWTEQRLRVRRSRVLGPLRDVLP
ncbi:MAG: penicillin acylase family protein [Haloarculaceae archaeon]